MSQTRCHLQNAHLRRRQRFITVRDPELHSKRTLYGSQNSKALSFVHMQQHWATPRCGTPEKVHAPPINCPPSTPSVPSFCPTVKSPPSKH
eukprot:scaffold98812_cov18-Tisochrysis_lutea.AAC.1